MKLDHALGWMVNAVTIAVLPARIGILGAPLWFFLSYAVIAGVVMTLADDLRYARAIFARADVRNYIKVRIALVTVCGIAPFAAGRALSW